MLQGLLSEIEKVPETPHSRVSASEAPVEPVIRSVDIHVSTEVLGVALHVMHGTWLTWQFFRTSAFVCKYDKGSPYTFGVRLSSQTITLGASPDAQSPSGQSSNVVIKIALPSFHSSGVYSEMNLEASASVHSFNVILKPKFVDDFLVIQQKFGSDFNDILDLITETRGSKPAFRSSSTAQQASSSFAYRLAVELEGFRIGIEGPTSTQYLDSSTIHGKIFHNTTLSRLQWHIIVSNLALSLAHHSDLLATRTNFDRKYRSAYMVIDMDANNFIDSRSPDVSGPEYLNVRIRKVHATMQAAAMGELGDIIDHVQVR
jgi:hypothetical protein